MENIQITHECVKKISNVGHTVYQNICNGSTQTVPWGSMDWIGIILVGALLLALLGMTIPMIVEVVQFYRRGY